MYSNPCSKKYSVCFPNGYSRLEIIYNLVLDIILISFGTYIMQEVNKMDVCLENRIIHRH